MFSKKFSWHKPAWWNSFVRRRAWIRKRTKKENKHYSQDTSSMMFNPEYFTVRPSSEIERSPSRLTSTSQQPQRAPSRGSRLSISIGVDDFTREDIETVDELLLVLRQSRIDREKIEAVDNYLEHSTEDELEGLQHVMHEIMSIFVFQASRRVLLTRLTEVYDRTVERQKKLQKKKKGDGRPSTDGDKDSEEAKTKKRAENLAKAIKHADEEVRRLEYWSDVKGMAEGGDSKGAVDYSQGWDTSWQGVDKSGPSEPPPPEGVQESKK